MNIYYNNSLVRDVKFFRNISYIYVIIYKDKSVYIGQSFAKVKKSRSEKHLQYFSSPESADKHKKLYVKEPYSIIAFSAPEIKEERLYLEHFIIRDFFQNGYTLMNKDKFAISEFSNDREYKKTYMSDYYSDIEKQKRHLLNSRISSKKRVMKRHEKLGDTLKVKEDLTALKALLETRKEFYGVPYDMAKI